MEIAVGTKPGEARFGGDASLSEDVAPGVVVLAVADAFGSLRGNLIGQIALGAICEVLRRRLRLGVTGRTDVSAFMRNVILSAFSSANARVFAQSGNHDDCVAGGASLTAALICDGRLFVGHVGESRAYLIRHGAITSLTDDDALKFDAPRLAGAVIPLEPIRHTLLTRSLGTQPTLEATVVEVELHDDDQLILCTDGVHRNVAASELCEVIAGGDSSAEAVSHALSLVRERETGEFGTIIVARTLEITATHAHDVPEIAERLRRGVAIAGVVSLFVSLVVLLLVCGAHI